MSAIKIILKTILATIICIIVILIASYYGHKSLTNLLEEKEVVQQIDDFFQEQVNRNFPSNDNSGITNNTSQEPLEVFGMTPEDCFPEELFDEKQQVCYYECATDEECTAIEAKIQGRLDEFAASYRDEAGEMFQEIQSDETPPLASYAVAGDTISLQSGEDVQGYHDIWAYFTYLIPQEYRSNLVGFNIFSDGIAGTLAAISQSEQDPAKWILEVDPDDAYADGAIKEEELTYSLIHETAHLFTLSTEQVPLDTRLYSSRTQEIYDQRRIEGKTSCAPRYYTGDGCSNEQSYINQFVQTFWKDLLGDYEKISAIEDKETRFDTIERFYKDHSDQFVTPYAATSPDEDIAESFTSFVLTEQPAGNTVAEQKILFFYQYEELLSLRESIRLKIR